MYTPANVDQGMSVNHTQVQKVEYWKGSDNWTPKDVIRVLKEIKPTEGSLNERKTLGPIISDKLIAFTNDPTIPFHLIEAVVLCVLETNICFSRNLLLFMASYSNPASFKFLKEFIKHGEKDKRYYNLIYKILVDQFIENRSTPLGAYLEHIPGFMENVFAKLPEEMQNDLRKESYNIDDNETDRRTCYQLIGGGSVSM